MVRPSESYRGSWTGFARIPAPGSHANVDRPLKIYAYDWSTEEEPLHEQSVAKQRKADKENCPVRG